MASFGKDYLRRKAAKRAATLFDSCGEVDEKFPRTDETTLPARPLSPLAGTSHSPTELELPVEPAPGPSSDNYVPNVKEQFLSGLRT